MTQNTLTPNTQMTSLIILDGTPKSLDASFPLLQNAEMSGVHMKLDKTKVVLTQCV